MDVPEKVTFWYADIYEQWCPIIADDYKQADKGASGGAIYIQGTPRSVNARRVMRDEGIDFHKLSDYYIKLKPGDICTLYVADPIKIIGAKLIAVEDIFLHFVKNDVHIWAWINATKIARLNGRKLEYPKKEG